MLFSGCYLSIDCFVYLFVSFILSQGLVMIMVGDMSGKCVAGLDMLMKDLLVGTLVVHLVAIKVVFPLTYKINSAFS